MNNPVIAAFMIAAFMQTDGPFNPQSDPRPENWDETMPPVKAHLVRVHEFDEELRLVFPGLDIWIKKSDLRGLQ